MRKILITGGPVHAHLDAVKIVTNRFRGGLMSQLAARLANDSDCQVVYLTAPRAVKPHEHDRLLVLEHKGFFDYRDQVLGLAQSATDVILGAAVANLIPANPWKGKFPSHDYAEGDVVPIDFLVTPRVITEVKRHAPNVNLFGFKLLAGAPHEELMRAAWETLFSSRATAVIANEAGDLQTKYVRTREGAVHRLANDALAPFLREMMLDKYYRTCVVEPTSAADRSAERALASLLARFQAHRPELFVATADGMVFGTAAVRDPAGGFWTTGRGKRELQERVRVASVTHATRTVYAEGARASLNAPLLDTVFKTLPQVQSIVHGHVQDPTLPTLGYAQPGTVADSQRAISGSFNIAQHGCFYLLDAQDNLIR
jgi:phosphopantothenate-cysteine ligase